MHLKLPYYKDRPSVTLQLQTQLKQWKYFTALIDSGADFSIFPLSAAIILDIETEKLKLTKVETADGEIFEIYKTEILAKLENQKFNLPIGFSKKIDITPLVGRSGFFQTFKITFDELEKITILNSY